MESSLSFTTHDDRCLGVPVRRIEVRDVAANSRRSIRLNDPCLTQGFHPVQDWRGESWRWTNGEGLLSSRLWAGARGLVLLEIELARDRGQMRAWIEPKVAEQRTEIRAKKLAV